MTRSARRAAIVSLMVGAAVLVSCASPPARQRSSAESFNRIATVLLSPRCLNCHPAGDFPRQGDERRRHDVLVVRGANDRGAPGMLCETCHQASNQSTSNVPGAAHWQLAPRSMAWEGLTAAQLCRAIVDPQSNGGRSIAQIVHHMTEDALVQWAWTPGAQRHPPPIAQDEFHALVRSWADNGAVCPDFAG